LLNLIEHDEVVTRRQDVVILGCDERLFGNVQNVLIGLGLECYRPKIIGYEKLKGYNTNKLYNQRTAAVIIGPSPHSAKGKENESSLAVGIEEQMKMLCIPTYRTKNMGKTLSKTEISIALRHFIDSGALKSTKVC